MYRQNLVEFRHDSWSFARNRLSSAMSRHSGKRLRDLRIRRGLSQEQLAARAGLSRDTVFRAEKSPDLSVRHSSRRLIADALGLSLEEFDKVVNPGILIGPSYTAIPVINVGYDMTAQDEERLVDLPLDDIDWDDDLEDGVMSVPSDLCGLFRWDAVGAFAIRMPDSRLQPEVLRRDVVVFSPRAAFQNGDLAVAHLKGSRPQTLIAFVYDEDDRFRLLVPGDNPPRIFIPKVQMKSITVAVTRVRIDQINQIRRGVTDAEVPNRGNRPGNRTAHEAHH